ncbi:unnamed protein product [Lactuca saligna]|uniref:ATP-dependent DNA helicase n=1 Tax=Lactuca saligna TaxID=75948 RepID=A0AA35VNC8_LACSI|nr:unnamed protein product [Lactuca saligna]
MYNLLSLQCIRIHARIIVTYGHSFSWNTLIPSRHYQPPFLPKDSSKSIPFTSSLSSTSDRLPLPPPSYSCRYRHPADVDLDLGNYERFLDVRLTRYNSITTGKIYQTEAMMKVGIQGRKFRWMGIQCQHVGEGCAAYARCRNGGNTLEWQAIEAVDRTMQDITDEKLPFSGKIMVMGPDFRQVLPVVRRGTRAQIVDSILQMSPLCASVKRLRLNINMRAVNDPRFSDFFITMDALIDAIFPSLQSNDADSKFIISRAILSTKNESVDEINNKLIE